MESTLEVVFNELPDMIKADKQSLEKEIKGGIDDEQIVKEKELEQNETSSDSCEKVGQIIEKIKQVDVDDDDDDNEDKDDNDGKEVEKGSKQNITKKEEEEEEAINASDCSQSETKTITPIGPKTIETILSVKKQEPTKMMPITEIKIPAIEEVEKATGKDISGVTKKEDTNEYEKLQEDKDKDQTKENNKEEEIEEEVKQEGKEQIMLELNKSEDYSKQQLFNKYQIPEESESQSHAQDVKEVTVVDAPSTVSKLNQHENNASKRENLNNTIKDIISSIDCDIKADESIATLKEKELQLLKKQHELAMEIEQQKLLAQKLANENQLQQELNNNLINLESNNSANSNQSTSIFSKYTTLKEEEEGEEEGNQVYSRKSETFESRESTNLSKKIDLNKIFTPATDAEEILPKNRKLYASSAFYSPTLHPTVEDQVELARRISHSLSDISNQQSRGQSMYVNRKKRSVKWVHEGCGQDVSENKKLTNQDEYGQDEKENNANHYGKVPLKFLMNPSGQMRDINSICESINTETGLLSPDVSAEVVTALQAQKGKGAELFAKRRKVSEKWVVDESNVGAQSPSGLPDYHQYQQQPKPPTSPSILPAYTDAAKHRVQLNLHQEQLLEKYAKPGLKVIQTPWEAALNSGSASTAFIEEQKLSTYTASTLTPSPTPHIYDDSVGGVPVQSFPYAPDNYIKSHSNDNNQRHSKHILPQQQAQQYTGSLSQRELAYKPSIPQGWKAPSMSLPKDLYMPKEIPIQSYAPPPVASFPLSVSPFSSNGAYETNQFNTYKPLNVSRGATYALQELTPSIAKPYGGNCSFPISKPYQQGFSSTYGNSQPPRQQYLPPESYKKVPQNTGQNVTQVNFNPSPLPYDKLAKFENQPADDGRGGYINRPSSRTSHFNVRGNKIRNTSPAPFAGSFNRSYTPSSDSHLNSGGTPNASPRLPTCQQQYSGHSTPNYLYPNVTSNQLLNAPSYNTSARGWYSADAGAGIGANTCYPYPQNHISATKSQIVNTASMPYTDF